MKKFIIKGPNKSVKGEVNISGAKNSCLPLMAASILFKNKVVLKNVPFVKDVHTMKDLLIAKNETKISDIYIPKVDYVHVNVLLSPRSTIRTSHSDEMTARQSALPGMTFSYNSKRGSNSLHQTFPNQENQTIPQGFRQGLGSGCCTQ